MNRRGAEAAEDLPNYLNEYSGAVIGAAIEVHRHLGAGFLESIYEESLAIELRLRGIGHRRQVPVPVSFKGHRVGDHRVDLLVEDELIVELKAVDSILPIHRAQVLSYLRASRNQLALLINFNVHALRDGIHRVILRT